MNTDRPVFVLNQPGVAGEVVSGPLGTVDPTYPPTVIPPPPGYVWESRVSGPDTAGNYREELRPMLRPTEEKPDPAKPAIVSPYLTLSEAAAYCRVAEQTIQNHRREIQVVKRRPLLFTREALDHWLSSKRASKRSRMR